ncbi:DUF6597 domain-containing transcriptional factor [Chitinophaga arvensicola]|uniref:HTH araC/xylS-type domain-containing protein n=1 Tax=Chitinophaga arvensicola TaxID=29529 RepID=A0A1I0R5Z7_9BACT|nr:DUF6597 domain-containing transcriptional factor [Chitinophaga arvensicola]SEW36012.1 hypothetical protein SAMN04488122_2341 [Chitinophaga arvensicola]
MNFHIYHPADALRPFVKQYYYWEDDTRGIIQLPQNLFALGDQYLVFILEGKAEIKPVNHKAFTLPEAAVLGHLTCACQLQVQGPVKVAVVQLNAYGAYRLLGMDAGHFTNYYRNLLLDTPSIWQELFTALRLEQAPQQVEPLLDTACLQALALQPDNLREVDNIADYLLIMQGNVSMEALTTRYGISRPTLERIFSTIVGIPPQLYARMIRYKTALSALRQLNLPEWQTPVAATPFYNQAMFIKDYLLFNHQAPSYFANVGTIAHMQVNNLHQVAVAS